MLKSEYPARALSLFIFLLVFIVSSCAPTEEELLKKIREGREKMHYSDFKAAEEIFSQVISMDAEHPEAYFRRGNARMNLKNYHLALEDFSRAIELKPDYADAYANRGQLKFYMHDKDGACKDWLKAEDLGKTNLREKTKFCDREGESW